MAAEKQVQLSVLERLTDRNLERTVDPPRTEEETLDAARRALREDLMALLNTRQTIVEVPEEFEELQRSVFTFGLPDLTSMGRDSLAAQALVRRWVEEELRYFEPRLTGIRVVFHESEDEDERSLHFVIEAMMKMDPEPERVVFETTLDPSRGGFQVGDVQDA